MNLRLTFFMSDLKNSLKNEFRSEKFKKLEATVTCVKGKCYRPVYELFDIIYKLIFLKKSIYILCWALFI